jgi:hypothetical protein
MCSPPFSCNGHHNLCSMIQASKSSMSLGSTWTHAKSGSSSRHSTSAKNDRCSRLMFRPRMIVNCYSLARPRYVIKCINDKSVAETKEDYYYNRRMFGLIRLKGIGETPDFLTKLILSANMITPPGFYVGQIKVHYSLVT